MVYPQGYTAAAGAAANATSGGALARLVLPELPKHRLRRIVRPSTAFADANPDEVLATPAERARDPRDPEAARVEGIALHALLQHLMKVPHAAWPAVSAKALAVLLPDHPQAHQAIARKAQSILTRLDLIHIFGPTSRAEVPVLAHGTRNGAPITIAGRIDRLVVEPGRVLIVDYKSDADVPATEKDVPAAYLSQIGLYAQIAGQLFPGH